MGQPEEDITHRAEAPPDVARLAEARGLGALVDVRAEITMGAALLRSLVIGGGSLALMILFSVLFPDPSQFSLVYSVLRFVVLFLLFMLVWAVATGIRALVVGSRAHYLYAGGLVHTRRRGPRAVAWPEVVQLRSVYSRNDRSSPGKVLGYRVEARDSASFVIPLLLADGRDAFVDAVVANLRAHGRPIN
jgi:hypothetical protein